MIRTLATLIALLLPYYLSYAQTPPPTKVGAILPLTGPVASIGDAMRRGIELAVSESRNDAIQVIFEDDATANRVQAVNAARKLVSIDKVELVLNAYASSVSAIYPTLQEAGVPCIVIWDSNRALPALGKHIVGFGYSNERAGEKMAAFAFVERKRKSAAIIAFHDEWSEIIARAFEEKYRTLGGTVVLHEVVNGAETNFNALLTRVKAKGAEAIYLPLYGTALSSAIKQARNLRFEGDILTPDGFTENDIRQIGQAAEGVFATQVWFDDQNFEKRYEAKFGEVGTSGVKLGYAALAYDSVKLIQALREKTLRAGAAPSSTSFVQGLPGFSFSGALGETLISQQNATDRRQPVVEVKDGKFELRGTHHLSAALDRLDTSVARAHGRHRH